MSDASDAPTEHPGSSAVSASDLPLPTLLTPEEALTLSSVPDLRARVDRLLEDVALVAQGQQMISQSLTELRDQLQSLMVRMTDSEDAHLLLKTVVRHHAGSLQRLNDRLFSTIQDVTRLSERVPGRDRSRSPRTPR